MPLDLVPRPKTIPDDQLLEHARDRFLADGVNASTRNIAAEAGVSEGVLFQRFGTKHELFFRAMRLPPPDLGQPLQSAMRARSFRPGLTSLSAAALETLRAMMPVVLLVLSHPAARERLQAGTNEAHALLSEAATLHESFARYFADAASRERIPNRDYGPTIGILVGALLSRALHEQVGFVDQADEEGWLRKTIVALDRGISGRG